MFIATLDPDGATLELKATIGGFQITVPSDWAIDFDDDSVAGGFDVDVTAPEDLPTTPQKLHIHAMAGCSIHRPWDRIEVREYRPRTI